jgi:hypothetical protein
MQFAPEPHRSRPDVSDGTRCSLVVVPDRQGDGFRATVRDYKIDLADPTIGDSLAQTPEALLILAFASAAAWFARQFLRAHRLSEDVSVSARNTSDAGRSPAIEITVGVSNAVEAHAGALRVLLRDRLAAMRPDRAPTIAIRPAQAR